MASPWSRDLLLSAAAAAALVALLLHRRSRQQKRGRSLTSTQRNFATNGGPIGAAGEYETDTALNEYLHFHYGPKSSFLDKALLGRSTMITSGFERVKEICFQHATSFHHALDVGCACGALSFALSERFQRVVGLDTSLSFVQACGTLQRRRAVPYVLPGQQVRCAASISTSVRPERCSFACMDATEFLQTGARFDLILACNVLCRLARPRQWLALLRDSLEAGGVVVLVTPYAWLEAWTPREEWLGDNSEESSRVLADIMTRNGFSKLHHEEIPFVLAQNDRIYELFISELTVWSAASAASPGVSPT
ncbi:unnamed protein product [Cladocopium goreaui]|uniref:Methyltransferase type 12 domain-containing protein n=1 Tax=Cladocopium goreaui TaxID=2562237 RepID=A0A9P1GMN5_9DINO|nr:unnamed protein product [Cladocopium goreaui]